LESLRKQRKIIHVDMDAFFASVEQRDFPEYLGKPLIVGGKPDSRGVVAACSYEARKFGIHSAMSCAQAYRLCPDAIFVKPRFEAYKEVSQKIREIFWRYASRVEPLSLDEAYLDVTYTADYDGSATLIAEAIRREIKEETGLTASAGVSYNKFLAKIASDMNKPDGLYVIKPEAGEAFVAALPVGKFFGVGPATEKKMHAAGFYTGADIKARSLEALQQVFGKSASYYYQIARGIDDREVRSSRTRKSLGKETTFASNILDVSKLIEHLQALAKKVYERLEQEKLYAKTITIKVKYANFQQVTRSMTLSHAITSFSEIECHIPALLKLTEAGKMPVRLVGFSASGFASKAEKKPSATDPQLALKL